MKNYERTQIDMTEKKLKETVKWEGKIIREMELHKFRYEDYIKFLQGYVDKDMRVLDIGCRDGGFLAMMRENFDVWKLYGIEINETASVLAGDRGIKIYNIDAHDLSSLEPNHYDLITLTHFLEHTHNPKAILDQIIKILKPKGLIFIEVPLEPMPQKLPTQWGHYFTFQSPGDVIKMLNMVTRGSGYIFETVKQQRDNKKNKWYRILVRKNMVGKKI